MISGDPYPKFFLNVFTGSSSFGLPRPMGIDNGDREHQPEPSQRAALSRFMFIGEPVPLAASPAGFPLSMPASKLRLKLADAPRELPEDPSRPAEESMLRPFRAHREKQE